MKQEERLQYLIRELLQEKSEYAELQVPQDVLRQKDLLRSLFNVRMPHPVSKNFLQVQDAYLQEEISQKGITDLEDLIPVEEDLYLWQGDITTLRCDAIVNAANDQMLGCFVPCHGCIDNAIHTYAGIQLRYDCAKLMKAQGHAEPTGKAKITSAYNLPCRYIIHTVGPIIFGKLTDQDRKMLESCYRSCLELAEEYNLQSIAFCCISTGEFHFPNDEAAKIAIETVKNYKKERKSKIKVIFNVFKQIDLDIYKELFQSDKSA